MCHRTPHEHACAACVSQARVVDLRIALNGVSGSNSSVRYNFYEHPRITALEPRAGPWRGGTRIVVRGVGLSAHASPFGLEACRFGDVAVALHVVNDTTGHCIAPSHEGSPLPDGYAPGWSSVVYVTVALNGQDFGPVPPPLEAAYTYYAPPRLLAISPLGAADSGGTNVSFAAEGLRVGGATMPPGSGPTAPKCVFGNASELAWTANATEHGTQLTAGAETRWSFLGGWHESGGWCTLPSMFGGALSTPRPIAFTVAMNGQDIGGGAQWDNLSLVIFPAPSLLSGAVLPTAQPPAAAAARAAAAAAAIAAAEAAADATAAVLAAQLDLSKQPTASVATATAAAAAENASLAAAAAEAAEAADAAAEANAALTPASGPGSGGTRVTVHGSQLNSFFTDVPTPLGSGISACRFGDVLVPLLPGARQDAGVCYAPPNTLGSHPLLLTLNGIDFFGAPPSAPPVTFLYFAAPQLLAAAPNGGPIGGGTRVTLLGRGLLGGAAAAALATARRCELCDGAAIDLVSPTRCVGGTTHDGRVVTGGGGYSAGVMADALAGAAAGPAEGAAGAAASMTSGIAVVGAGEGVDSAGCVTLASPNGTVPLKVHLPSLSNPARRRLKKRARRRTPPAPRCRSLSMASMARSPTSRCSSPFTSNQRSITSSSQAAR